MLDRIFTFITAIVLIFWADLARPEVKLVVGPGVSQSQSRTISSAISKAEKALNKQFGFKTADGTTVFASSDAEYLARQYVRFTGNGSVSQKQNAFVQWISGEAVFRGVFINLASKHNHSKSNLQQNLLHELFHVFQYELVGAKSKRCCHPTRVSVVGPTWLMEGSASYFHASFDKNFFRGYLEHGRKNRRGMGSAGLALFETRRGTNTFTDAYPVSAYAVSLLIKSSGAEAIPQFYDYIGRGQKWEGAFQKAFGMTVDQFYRDFAG